MPVRVNLPNGSVVNFPDGTPPDEINHAIAGMAGPSPAKPRVPQTISEPTTFAGGFLRSLKNQAVDALPMIGGTLGAMATAPGIGASIAGASIGGAGGAALRSAIQQMESGRPQTAGNVAGDMAIQGAAQGGIQALTHGTGRILTKMAPSVMDMGLKRTAADRLAFPSTPARLVNEGIIPRGQNVQRALTATEGKIGSEAARFDAANPMGRVDPDALAQTGRDFAHQSGKVGGLGNVPGPEAAELDKLQQNYLNQNTRSRTLGETIEQKRAYQARAKYSSRPNSPTVTNNELNFNEGVAGANRAAAIKLNPALEGDLAKERDLIGALTAQQNAEAKAMPLSTVGSVKTLMGLRNPTMMGGAAIGADRLGRSLQSPLTPAALRAAILALVTQHDETR